jgi:hypothetical protein
LPIRNQIPIVVTPRVGAPVARVREKIFELDAPIREQNQIAMHANFPIGELPTSNSQIHIDLRHEPRGDGVDALTA